MVIVFVPVNNLPVLVVKNGEKYHGSFPANCITLNTQTIPGLWDPFQMAFHFMAAMNGNDPKHLRYTSWDDHPPSREDEGIQEKVMWNHAGNVSMYVLRSVYVIYYCLETFSNIPCLKTNSSPL